MLDKNRIFENFNSVSPLEEEIEIKKIGKTPKQNLNSFILWCLRYLDFVEFSKSMVANNEGLDYDTVLLSGEQFIVTKAFSYLEKVNGGKISHYAAIITQKSPYFVNSLDFAIRYYEKVEEYEKCAFIQKIKEIFENRKDNLDK